MVDLLIVVIIVAAAALYVVYTLHRQFTGKGDCGAGCSCQSQLKQQCQTHQYLDNLSFDLENSDPPPPDESAPAVAARHRGSNQEYRRQSDDQ